MPGIVIAFDGIDGCGKDKQIELTKAQIESEYLAVNVIIHQQPWRNKESPFGAYIDQVLKHKVTDISPVDDPNSFQKYYTADRFFLWSLLIQDELDQVDATNIILLSRDRMSTEAFGHAFGLPLDRVVKWHQYIPTPHLYFFLRVSAETAMNRIRRRDGEKTEYFEEQERLKKISCSYEETFVCGGIPHLYPIDGEGTAEEVSRLLIPIVKKYLYDNLGLKG